MRLAIGIAAVFLLTAGSPTGAENRSYGQVEFIGLARENWPVNPPGESNAMVCNVNGPDGYLTIRTSPTSNSNSARKLKRLAILVVDTANRRGHWIRVLSAHRNHTINGKPRTFRKLPVTGWAHDDYLCDFLD